ncbi:MAG: replication-relaxation family protein [Gallionellaceae bacterium]
MGQIRTSYPRFRREGETPRIDLTQDDIAILRYIYRHRFIRADDIYRLFPDRSQDKLSRRLTRLYRGQFLDRPIAQIDRFREGGSQSLVYGLDNAGARYLKDQAGMPIGPSDWRARNRSYTRESLDHTLAIARFLVDLEVCSRLRTDVSVIPFEDILAESPAETRQSRTPMSWPVPVQWSSGRAAINVVPDAVFGLRLQRQTEKPMQSYVFLEIDRGTMTIMPAERVRDSEAFLYRTTMLRKFLSYAESWRQGLHKQQFNISAARVVTLTTSSARVEAMQRAAHDLVVKPLRLPAGLFLFGVQSTLADPFGIDFEDSTGRRVQLLPTL